MKHLLAVCVVLILLSFNVTAQKRPAALGGWKREQSVDRETRERSTAVSKFSSNADKFFGRSGHGTVKFSGYMSLFGATFYTFAKIVPSRFQDVKLYVDDAMLQNATCVNSDESTNKFTCILSESILAQMLKGKTLKLEHKGTDDETHTLLFSLVGLSEQLNFLEVKRPK